MNLPRWWQCHLLEIWGYICPLGGFRSGSGVWSDTKPWCCILRWHQPSCDAALKPPSDTTMRFSSDLPIIRAVLYRQAKQSGWMIRLMTSQMNLLRIKASCKKNPSLKPARRADDSKVKSVSVKRSLEVVLWVLVLQKRSVMLQGYGDTRAWHRGALIGRYLTGGGAGRGVCCADSRISTAA